MSYAGLAADYVYQAVDLAVEFVRDNVHTNRMENVWRLFKRALKGTYLAVEAMHLNAHVKQQTFRFNERKTNDGNRFHSVLGNVTGTRITYKKLTGHVTAAA
jgi:hypothetical protein